jgi:GxxExxY protein
MDQDSVLTRRVIGCAIEVHRTLGPGLLESVYEACLCQELTWAGIAHARQQKLPVIYKGDHVDCDLKIDVIVEQSLVLEIKSVQQILPVHEAQLLTYLRVSGFPLGLLLNFNEETMKQGIRRRIL